MNKKVRRFQLKQACIDDNIWWLRDKDYEMVSVSHSSLSSEEIDQLYKDVSELLLTKFVLRKNWRDVAYIKIG